MNFGFKKNSKTSPQLSSRWSGGVVVALARTLYAVNIYAPLSSRILTFQREHFQREREREKSV